MVVDTISDFLLSNNYTKKFIAIDFGLKHIGIAISDPCLLYTSDAADE